MPEPQEWDEMKLNIRSLSYSTTLTIIFVVMLTLWSEISKSLKTFLASITGHHWVTKGVFSLVFFVIVYFVISRTRKDSVDSIHRIIYPVIIATVLGGIIIFGFYVWHFTL